MPVINRELDVSEQKLVYTDFVGLVATGSTYVVANIVCPGVLKAAAISSQGLSGSPVVSLEILRFNPGAGLTGILLGATVAISAIGTSGVQSFTLPTAGATLLNLQTGDQVVVRNLVANSAIAIGSVAVATQATADYKQILGSTT